MPAGTRRCCGSSWPISRELGFDLGLIGFGEGELERLLAGEGKAGLTEDDDAPALPEQAVTQPGDLWILGEHRLLCGDATVLADVERVLGGQLADMTFTDPPYNVDYGNSPKDKLRGKHRPILNDNLGSGLRGVPARRLRQHPRGHQRRRATSACHHPSCTRCSGRSPRPAANGRRS